jgi:hypothetical protein
VSNAEPLATADTMEMFIQVEPDFTLTIDDVVHSVATTVTVAGTVEMSVTIEKTDWKKNSLSVAAAFAAVDELVWLSTVVENVMQSSSSASTSVFTPPLMR